MMLWLLVGGMTLAVMALLLAPLLRSPRPLPSRQAHDVEVYRDQLDELAAERARGLLSDAEAAEAEREIKRRILRTAEEPERRGADGGGWRIAAAGTLAVAVPVLAALIYTDLGRPWEPDRPLAARQPAPGPASPAEAQQPDIASMAERLHARLAANPEDRQGWLLLGRSYWELGRFGDAAEAYRQALALGEREPGLVMAYAEALVFAAEGMVTPVARQALNDLVAAAPAHPGARYYLGLAELQADNPQGAYRAWLALARDTPAGAPWIEPLRRRLLQVGQGLGIAVESELPEAFRTASEPAPPGGALAAIPGPTAEDVRAAQDMSPEDRAAFIRSMVQRLADRLKDEPDDADGWMRLGRAYAVLGEHAASADAFGRAATLQPDNSDALYNAGVGAARAGDLAGAVGHWESLLARMDPASEQYGRLRRELDQVKSMR